MRGGHLDPYGVRRNGYDITVIPEDMGYLSGFSRRFGKPLMPWLQAHAYGDLVTPSADDIRRIFGQHLPLRLMASCGWSAVCGLLSFRRGFRNPADEMLRYFLRVWTMEKKGFFDTFEILPHESPAEKADRERELKNYDWIVSTVPYPGALVIGAGTEGTILTERQIIDMMPQFRKTIEGNLK